MALYLPAAAAVLLGAIMFESAASPAEEAEHLQRSKTDGERQQLAEAHKELGALPPAPAR